MTPRMTYALAFSPLLFAACGSDDPSPSTVYAVKASSATACPGGGQNVSLGSDKDGDGKLSDGEVRDSIDVCTTAPTPASGIVKTMHCSTLFGSAPTIRVNYDVTLFASGDVWASGEVADGYVQASGSDYYRASQSGAATAAILVTLDTIGGNTSGYWAFAGDLSAGTATVAYNDLEVSATPTSDALTCSVN